MARNLTGDLTYLIDKQTICSYASMPLYTIFILISNEKDCWFGIFLPYSNNFLSSQLEHPLKIVSQEAK